MNANAQLKFFQILSVVLVVILLSGAGFYFYREHTQQPVSIIVDGKPIATLGNMELASAALREALAANLAPAFVASGHPVTSQPVAFKHAGLASSVIPVNVAVGTLAAVLNTKVTADAIVIDGKPIVALPNKDIAQAALDSVRQHYAAMPPDDTVIGQPTFQENVTIVRKQFPAAICVADAEDAVKVLVTPPQAKTYVVQPRQTGWLIARKFHMSFTNFVRANSGRDLNNIKPGDQVNISATYPPLTVIIHKVSSTTEPILRGVVAADAGIRRSTMIYAYINGVRVGEPKPVSLQTIQRAKPAKDLE